MQKITVSLILWKYRPNKNGEFSIYLRFGSGAKAKLTKTGYTCRESDWDKNKCRVKGTLTNSGIINADLNRQLNKSLDAIGEIKNDYSQNNLETVKEIVKADSIDTNFYKYTETKIEFLKAKYSRFTILNLKSLNIKFNNFAPEIKINEITVKVLQNYEYYLRDVFKHKSNTIWASLKFIKQIINVAINDNIIKKDDSPFIKYKYKYLQSIRTHLTSDEVSRIEKYILLTDTKSYYYVVGSYFLLSCYSGLRYGDAKKFNFNKHIVNERLILKPGKGIDSEIISIPLHTRLRVAIDRLKGIKKLHVNSTTNSYLKEIAKGANIDKVLTFHVARHTFAMECANMGMSIETVSVLLGHKDIKTTSIYYKVSNKRVDLEMSKWQ